MAESALRLVLAIPHLFLVGGIGFSMVFRTGRHDNVGRCNDLAQEPVEKCGEHLRRTTQAAHAADHRSPANRRC